MFHRDLIKPLLLWIVFTVAVDRTAVGLDTVTRRSTDKRAAGEITEVSKTEVTVKPKVGSATTVPANDIERIEWDGEPGSLKLARSNVVSGQYELAIENFNKAKTEAPAGQELLQNDITYGICQATGKLALVDAEQQSAAIELLNKFLEEHAEHYRYYDALLLLGDVHLAREETLEANAAFNRVAAAPWPDYQMAANLALGRTALQQGDVAAARTAFESVSSMQAKSPAEEARKFEALLGLATVLQRENKYQEAADALNEIIHNSSVDDIRLQAEAYVRQGDCYAAIAGREKDAVMAYLHLDVIPSLSTENDLQAEALYHLAKLWPSLGHVDRADLAAGKLQSEYPNSLWTKKLANE
ncbi:MAG: tetratricopeptide repeat protein [Planctomycetaceae bacterium]|nr:tetratricopeptide repeat protein [Planctomycetaceae bacterium]